MKVTGYRLREALKIWELRKKDIERAFPESLYRFKSDTTPQASTLEIAAELEKIESSIAQLQVAQMRYNLKVTSAIGSEQINLALAIKLAGSAERVEKLWKGTVVTTSMTRYGERVVVRDTNQERAEPTITSKDVLAQTTLASKRSGALRAAISSGNAVELEIENLDPLLFE